MLEVSAKTKKKQRNFRKIVVTAIAGLSLVSVAMPIAKADISRSTRMSGTAVSPRTADASVSVSSTAKYGYNGLTVRLENRTSGAATAWRTRDQATNIPAGEKTTTTTIGIKSKDILRRTSGYRRQGQANWIYFNPTDSTVS